MAVNKDCGTVRRAWQSGWGIERWRRRRRVARLCGMGRWAGLPAEVAGESENELEEAAL